MRILILEDDIYRITWFKENLKSFELDITSDTHKAIHFLQDQSRVYIAAFLDHDLREEHYQDFNRHHSNTGRDVADFLGQNPHCQPGMAIFIHSLNRDGAAYMKSALSTRIGGRCFIAPYNLLREFVRLRYGK